MIINRSYFAALTNLVQIGQIRAVETSMAIGYLYAQNLSMPTTRSDTLSAYFAGTHSGKLDEFLSALNDTAPVDYKTIRFYAEKYYALRHAMLFGQLVEPETCNAMHDVFGFSAFFSEDEIKFMSCPGTNWRNVIRLLCGIDRDAS